MDDFSLGGAELTEALKHLRRLNKIFAAPGPTKYGVEKLWKEMGRPNSLSILDVGAGSGDVNRKLLRWADERGIQLSITLVDMTAEACDEARALFKGENRVTVLQADVCDLPDASADIVTGSQFVHHFDGEKLVGSYPICCVRRDTGLSLMIFIGIPFPIRPYGSQQGLSREIVIYGMMDRYLSQKGLKARTGRSCKHGLIINP